MNIIQKIKRLALITAVAGLMPACSGQLVCEWQTEDERDRQLIEEVLRNAQKENVEEKVREAVLKIRQQDEPT